MLSLMLANDPRHRYNPHKFSTTAKPDARIEFNEVLSIIPLRRPGKPNQLAGHVVKPILCRDKG